MLYTDAVKYLERLNVRVRLLELRDALASTRAETARGDASGDRERVAHDLERLRAEVGDARKRVTAAWQDAEREQQRAARAAQESITRQLKAAAADQAARADQARTCARRAARRGARLSRNRPGTPTRLRGLDRLAARSSPARVRTGFPRHPIFPNRPPP